MAMTSDRMGPLTSGPVPWLQSASVARTAIGTSRRYRARQDALRGLRAALGSEALGSAGRWTNADQIPERAASSVRTGSAVIAGADVDVSQALAFTAFTDAAVFSRWLGVPVTLDDGRFACTMEWGTSVRGRYELTCPPELIVMRWDFEDDNLPVPGGEMPAYLRVLPRGDSARVEVHQLVETQAQAAFMEGAWGMVLGRLQAGVTRALDPAEPMPPRPARPKRH